MQKNFLKNTNMCIELSVTFLITLLLSFADCHYWIPDFQYSSVFDTRGFFQPSVFPYNLELHSFSTHQDFHQPYQSFPFQHDHSLVYKKIYENQLRAFSIISELENTLPCELRKTSVSNCGNAHQKQVFFSDYPHVKALLQLQWKRLSNVLDTHKLGSLRVNSPFFRP